MDGDREESRLHRPGRSRRSSICMLGIAALLAGLTGCASGRVDLPAARSRDAAALQREARASREPEPFYQLALLHYGQGDADAALAALHTALGRDPEYAPALTLVARVLHDSGRSAEGVRFFASRPASDWPPAVRLDLALLYVDVGNTVRARELLQGIGDGVYAEAAAANLADLDLLDEQHGRAIGPLTPSQTRFRDDPEVLNHLAVARLRAGDLEGASRLLQDIASRWPDFAPAQLSLALLLRDYFFDEVGGQRAQAHFDALAAPRPRTAALQSFFEPATEDTASPLQGAGAAADSTTRSNRSRGTRP